MLLRRDFVRYSFSCTSFYINMKFNHFIIFLVGFCTLFSLFRSSHVLIDNFISVGGSAAKDAKGSSTEQLKAHSSKLSKHKEPYHAIATRVGSPA